MHVELWIEGEKREERYFSRNFPAVGDLLQVQDDDGAYPYVVTKVYKHFDLENDMTLRVDLDYAGPSLYERTGMIVV